MWILVWCVVDFRINRDLVSGTNETLWISVDISYYFSFGISVIVNLSRYFVFVLTLNYKLKNTSKMQFCTVIIYLERPWWPETLLLIYFRKYYLWKLPFQLFPIKCFAVINHFAKWCLKNHEILLKTQNYLFEWSDSKSTKLKTR